MDCPNMAQSLGPSDNPIPSDLTPNLSKGGLATRAKDCQMGGFDIELTARSSRLGMKGLLRAMETCRYKSKTMSGV